MRVISAPGELFAHETSWVEHEALFVDEFVRIERICEDELSRSREGSATARIPLTIGHDEPSWASGTTSERDRIPRRLVAQGEGAAPSGPDRESFARADTIVRERQTLVQATSPRGKESTAHRFLEVPFPHSVVPDEAHSVSHHPRHEVVSEHDNLLAEPSRAARVRAEGDVRDLGEESFEECFGQGRTGQHRGGPRVGRSGYEKELRVGEEIRERGEKSRELGEEF